MNTLAIALVWCIVQVTLMSILAAGMYLVLRRVYPAAAAPLVFASLVMVLILSLLAFSPWPRWSLPKLFQSADGSSLASGASSDDWGNVNDPIPGADRLESAPATIAESSSANVVKKPTSPSPATKTLLQAFVEELSQPQAANSANSWRWPEIVALSLLTAMFCGLLWLVLGVLAVRRQRIGSQPVTDAALLELVDVLRAELSCIRPIEIRQSNELVTAATVGWRRPALLLPRDWSSWTPDQRRAVLAHEIAHARSHDFLALLFGQLGLMLHFYHPVVHWLMNRLRLEQELAADAAAANLLGGQRQYLTTIAELALSRQDRPLLWPARSFLPTRTTFLRRIAMLRDSKLHFERLSPTARTLTISLMVFGGLFIAGLRGPAGPQPAVADDTAHATVEKDASKQAKSENLLSNPGMEKGEEYAEDWLQGNSIEGVKYSWDKNVAFAGKASLGIEKNVNRYFPIAAWAQTVERKGDAPFLEVSAQVKAKKMFKAILDVVFLDANDQPISHEWAAAIGNKGVGAQPTNHDWKKYSGTVKIPAGTAKMSIELQDYGPGKVWFDDVQARYVKSKSQAPGGAPKKSEETPSNTEKIVEGEGWGKVRIGISRDELVGALGKPDNDDGSDWPRWNKLNIEVSLHPGSTAVTEVRFNPGFKGSLANGVKLGSPASDVEKHYGDKPSQIYKRDNGAENHIYSDKGIMLWTYQGKITQIIVMRPAHGETTSTTHEISAKDDDSTQPTGKTAVLGYVGESSTEMQSWADSGYAVEYERPADMKSVKAVKLFGSRYGTPRPPAEKFHIYLLDGNKKVLEHILVPYAKVQRGDMKWFTFEFPAIQVPEKFFMAFWFDAEQTKGVYVGKEMNKTETHSWTGLPDTGYHKEENFDWMIRAVVSGDEGRQPSYPKVKTYGEEDTGEAEIAEVSKKRIWNDASGAFSLEAEFAGLKDGKVSLKKADGKIIAVPLSQLAEEDRQFAAKEATKKSAETSSGNAAELSHDDGNMADKRSIGGGGYAVRFEAEGDSNYVTSVSLHGSRYGTPRAPTENFNVWICDEQFKPIATFHFPYSSYARAAPVWKSFKIKPTKVPEKFIVCFGFNAHQTKGVYVSYDAEGTGNSIVGVPGQGEPEDFEKGDWLIRCKVEKRGGNGEK